VPVRTMRDSAMPTAWGVPRSKKSAGMNTRAGSFLAQRATRCVNCRDRVATGADALAGFLVGFETGCGLMALLWIFFVKSTSSYF